MKYWRFKNFVRVLGKIGKIVEQRGLSSEQLKRIPFGDATRMIEAASLEEEDDVQERWVRFSGTALRLG